MSCAQWTLWDHFHRTLGQAHMGFAAGDSVLLTDLRPHASKTLINLFLSLIIHLEALTGTLGTPV